MGEASIPIPFATGEVVWWPGNIPRQEQIVCPVCSGKRVVTLVQGDGAEYEIECSACGLGFEEPRGFMLEWVYDFKPTCFCCSSVEVRGDEVNYREAGGRFASSKDLYRTEEECAVRCAEKTRESAEERERRGFNILGSAKEKMAWSLYYWLHKRADHVRQIEWIDRRVRLIKDRKMHLKANKEA